jgi:hypothetical protein
MTVPIQMFIGNVTLETSSGTPSGVPFKMFKGVKTVVFKYYLENYLKKLINHFNSSRL